MTTSSVPSRALAAATRRTGQVPGAHAALGVFVFGFCTLELSNPSAAIKPWNLVMVLAAVIAVAMMLLGMSRTPAAPQPRLFGVDAVFLTYLVYCGFSSFWSEAPVDSLVQVAYLFSAWLATLFLRVIPARQIVRTVAIVGFLLVLLSFAAVVIAPSQAFQPSSGLFPELRGIFQHQQRLGLFVGIILGLLIIAFLNGEFTRVLRMSRFHAVVVVSALLLCFGASFARLNMLFVAVALVMAYALMRSVPTRVIAMLMGILLAVWIWSDHGSLLAIIGGEGGATLTGRTTVWERTQQAIDAGSFFGYGFASFNAPVFDSFWGNYRAPSAHNSLLQATFETGIPGVVLIVVLILTQLRAAYSTGKVLERFPFSLFLVVLAVLSSLTGVTYAGKPTILLMLTLLVLASEMQEARQRGFAAREPRGTEAVDTRRF